MPFFLKVTYFNFGVVWEQVEDFIRFRWECVCVTGGPQNTLSTGGLSVPRVSQQDNISDHKFLLFI